MTSQRLDQRLASNRRGRMSVSIGPELAAWVRTKAETEGTTVSAVVERALESLRTAVTESRRR